MNFLTNPLFLALILTAIVVLVAYMYNANKQKKEGREPKGTFYYVGLTVVIFALSYGGAYLYQMFSTGGGVTELKSKVMTGGQKLVNESKKVVNSVKKASQPVVLEQSGGIGADEVRCDLPDW